jgi:tight adherence protein C
LAALIVGIGYLSTDFYLDKAASKRQTEIQHSLPDVLDQVSVYVEAGLGFDAALHRCAATNDHPLGDELARTLQDIRLGMPPTQALYGLLDRTDVQELRLFVRALVQAERSGIPIARVLLVQSDEVREKRRQAAEERAMKLPVLLIMPLVLCILPSLFTVIMGPAVLRMVREGAV